MSAEKKLFKKLYLRNDGMPRNYKPVVNDEVSNEVIVRQFTQSDIDELKAETQAFKSTQKKFAIGVVAVVGTGFNLLEPPSNVGEFVLNLAPAVVVQTIGYLSFKNGVHIVRDRFAGRYK